MIGVRRQFRLRIPRYALVVLALLAGSRLPCALAQDPQQLPPVEHRASINSELTALQQRVAELESALGSHESSKTAPAMHWNDGVERPTTVELAGHSLPSWLSQLNIDIGGYVKADLIHDFDAIGSTDLFDPLTIPTDGIPGENTRIHARQTRLNLDVRSNAGNANSRLFVESDFFGPGDSLRLRHAFFERDRFLVGQTWSTFMDETILPSTLDFESPRSVILDRRALFRWKQPVSDSLEVAFALEDPRPLFDLDSAPAGDLERPAPDLIGRVRYETGWGHLQSAALVRMLRFRQLNGLEDDEVGWGFNFTGRINPQEFDSLLFQVAFGEAIESYRQGPDAAVDSNGIIEVIPVIAWVVGYEIDWSERWTSTFVYSSADGTNAAFQLAEAPQAVEYVAANLVFHPQPGVSWGAEYLYGTRTDADDTMGKANRIQFSVRFDLP